MREMHDDHRRLFLGPERVLACPYESVYLNEEHLTFGSQTLAVREWYSRYGFARRRRVGNPTTTSASSSSSSRTCACLLWTSLSAATTSQWRTPAWPCASSSTSTCCSGRMSASTTCWPTPRRSSTEVSGCSRGRPTRARTRLRLMRVEMDTRPLRRWLTAATAPTAVLVACREHEHLDAWRVPNPGPARVVFRLTGCLADAPPAAFLEILAGGAVSVTGLLDGCAKPAGARRVLARAGRIAAAVAANQPDPLPARKPPQAPPAQSDRESPPPLSRRPTPVQGGRTRCPGHAVGRRALVGFDGAVGELDAHPGLRLLAVVRELLGGAPVPSGLDDVPTGAAVLAAGKCCGNGVCVRTCPTDALTLTVTDLSTRSSSAMLPNPTFHSLEPPVAGAATFSDAGLSQFALSIDPSPVHRLRPVCRAVPRVGDGAGRPAAVGAGPEGPATTLRVGIVEHCSRCGMPSAAAGSLCAVCAFRTSEPFGSAAATWLRA